MQMFGHRGPVTAADRTRLAEELAESGMAIGVTERACCCPARPVVRAVMPATTRRSEPVDLLLCGHHYRAGHVALLAAGAAVYDDRGVLIAGAPAGRRLRPRKTAAATREQVPDRRDWSLLPASAAARVHWERRKWWSHSSRSTR
jgi:hypothetical protein